MRARDTSFLLRWISLIFIVAAAVITILQLVSYSRLRSFYPPGMTIGGVPMGGITPVEASQRLLAVYGAPIEMRYNEAVIRLDPTLAGFELDMETMLAAADLQRTSSSFWAGFWDYLWNRQGQPVDIPLRASFAEERLRNYLRDEIASRYDQPATPAQPIPGQAGFTPGEPGQQLDIDRAVQLIEDALRSPSNRVVSLSFVRTTQARPSLDNLRILIEQIVALNNFTGVISFYMRDLQTGEKLQFLFANGTNYPIEPDLSFSASSTIKIPIMIAYYTRNGPLLDQEQASLVMSMIDRSENPPADTLMESIDSARGPLVVTDALQQMGYENTFLAGYFYPGAPLLQSFKTPGNSRTDLATSPDIYNQTSASEMGTLLEDLYQCSQFGGGALVAAFPGKITQGSCIQMIDLLKANRIGVLIEAGLPEGTQLAHKHGWVSDNFGVIRDISDVGIVYSPGGTYILAVYAYDPVQIVWEQGSLMIAQISQVVYNYFNLPTQ